jgi:hypothetical protein
MVKNGFTLMRRRLSRSMVWRWVNHFDYLNQFIVKLILTIENLIGYCQPF